MSFLSEFLERHPKIENVELVLVDPGGVMRGKWAPVSTLKKAFGEGVNFPLSLHGLDVWGNEVPDTGLHISSGDLDGFCVAVPHTLCAVPWGGTPAETADDFSQSEAKTAQLLLKTQKPDRSPFEMCARTVLEQAVDRLATQGLTPVCAFELEFHLLRMDSLGSGRLEIASFDETPQAQFMYDLDALAEKAGVFADIRRAAKWADLPVDTLVKEAGPGQYEINLNHRTDALRAADDVILLRRIIQECARRHGFAATFMAKPFTDQPGNGMHVHASMLDREGNNIFSGKAGDVKLRHAVAGMLETMAEMTLVFVNTHNGFRRMAPGSYAPTRINWGSNNRSVSVRLPAAPDAAKRVEHRVSGADANPYLVLAALLQALGEGLDLGAEPIPELSGNAYDPSTKNRGDSLPATQAVATELFSQSEFAVRALGQSMRDTFVAIKRAEIEGFRNDISPMEQRTFL